MTTTRIFHENGERVSWEYDDLTKKVVVKRTTDVEPVLENNKRLATMDDGFSPSREMRRVASIPLHVFENWLKADGLTWHDYYHNMDRRERAKYRARKMFDPDNRHFLTAPHKSRIGGINKTKPKNLMKP